MAGISIGNRFLVNPVKNDLVASGEVTGSVTIGGKCYTLPSRCLGKDGSIFVKIVDGKPLYVQYDHGKYLPLQAN